MVWRCQLPVSSCAPVSRIVPLNAPINNMPTTRRSTPWALHLRHLSGMQTVARIPRVSTLCLADAEACYNSRMTIQILDSQLRLRDLMIGFALLGVVLALARIAIFLQVEHGEPTTTSVVVQMAAGGILSLALSRSLVRLFRVASRDHRILMYAGCCLMCIPGVAYAVALLSIALQ
jgi:hypothetical protein